MGGGGGLRGVSQWVLYSCVHHVTFSPNKLWISTSIFNLWVILILNFCFILSFDLFFYLGSSFTLTTPLLLLYTHALHVFKCQI